MHEKWIALGACDEVMMAPKEDSVTNLFGSGIKADFGPLEWRQCGRRIFKSLLLL